VLGQLQAPTALPPEIECLEAEWASEPFLTEWKRENSRPYRHGLHRKQRLGWGNKCVRMKIESDVACVKALFPQSPGGTVENNENALIRITGVSAEIRTAYHPSPFARFHRTNINNYYGSATV
jgi:hypothetical protein